jgi:hypothetical protein
MREQLGQLQRQPAGAPLGMLLTKFQRPLAIFLVVRGSRRATRAIRGLKRIVAACFHIADHASHRALRHAKLLGHLQRTLAGLITIPNGLTNRGRNSAWHHRILSRKGWETTSPGSDEYHTATPVDKLYVTISDKLLSPFMDKLYVR